MLYKKRKAHDLTRRQEVWGLEPHLPSNSKVTETGQFMLLTFNPSLAIEESGVHSPYGCLSSRIQWSLNNTCLHMPLGVGGIKETGIPRSGRFPLWVSVFLGSLLSLHPLATGKLCSSYLIRCLRKRQRPERMENDLQRSQKGNSVTVYLSIPF